MALDTRSGRIGLGLIGGGRLLLVGSLFNWNFGAALWPLFILVPGLVCLAVVASGGRAVSGFFVPGSILVTLGLIFFVQIAADHFESWAYAWALVWAAVGTGLMLQGQPSDNAALVTRGQRLAGIASAAFFVGLIFFEGFIFADKDSWLFRAGLPVVLIGAGAFLLLRDEFGSPER